MQDNKRYQVFISSTYLDLKEERQKVSLALMQMDCIPAGMELFPAADDEQFEFITRVIDDCGYYVVIVGARYGSLTADGVSYTEKEFEYAKEKRKPVCAFLHHDPNTIPVKDADIDPVLRDRLEAFKTKLKTGRLVSTWTNGDDLAGKVVLSLQKTIKLHPRPGWIRGDAVAETDALKDLANINKENNDLRQQVEALRASRVPGRKVTESPIISFSYTVGSDSDQRQWRGLGLERWLASMGADLVVGLKREQFYNCVCDIISKETGITARIYPSVTDVGKLKTVMLAFDIVEIKELKGEFGEDELAIMTAEGRKALVDCMLELERVSRLGSAERAVEQLSRPAL